MGTQYTIGIIVAALLIIAGGFVIFPKETSAPGSSDTGTIVPSKNESAMVAEDVTIEDTTIMDVAEDASMTTQPVSQDQENVETEVETEAVAEPSAPQTPTVAYTDTGFEPWRITIQKGQTVTWTNESGRRMWVASALHPTHSIYPEKSSADCLGSSFDACTALAPGESYSFTFNVPGTWKYHNHVQARHAGTVVVE